MYGFNTLIQLFLYFQKSWWVLAQQSFLLVSLIILFLVWISNHVWELWAFSPRCWALALTCLWSYTLLSHDLSPTSSGGSSGQTGRNQDQMGTLARRAAQLWTISTGKSSQGCVKRHQEGQNAEKVNVGLSSETEPGMSFLGTWLRRGQLLSLVWGYLVLLLFLRQCIPEAISWALKCCLPPCWIMVSLINPEQATNRGSGLDYHLSSTPESPAVLCVTVSLRHLVGSKWTCVPWLTHLAETDQCDNASWEKPRNSCLWGQRRLWRCHL